MLLLTVAAFPATQRFFAYDFSDHIERVVDYLLVSSDNIQSCFFFLSIPPIPISAGSSAHCCSSYKWQLDYLFAHLLPDTLSTLLFLLALIFQHY